MSQTYTAVELQQLKETARFDYSENQACLTDDNVLKTVDIRSPKTGISVHYSYSLLMAMQIY